MPIISIPYQPATGNLLAAYRPVVLKAQATRTDGNPLPPYVVCDIYIDDLYYKSVIRTAAESTTTEYSIFQFDISDALQEYLQADLVTINNNNLVQAPHMSGKVFCRFRSSGLDSDGFTVEEGTRPVQGTKNTSPVAGTGTQSNTFFGINAALQHEDNQNLSVHLNAYKQGNWASNAYPLTHRNRYYFCNNDSDHFPLIFTGDCLATDIILHYRLKGQTGFQQATAEDINVCDGIDFAAVATGNRVDVHLDSAPPDGQSVLVQYKKQGDSVWITAGSYNTQDFSFNVNDPEEGDYDIRAILFCTACLSSDPETGVFSLDGTEINVAWRGIDPFCVLQTFASPIYILLEVRNEASDTVYYPDDEHAISILTTTTADLYCKFFSDAARLNPLTVNQAGLKIYVRKRANTTNENPFGTYYSENETLLDFTVDANGTEVLLGNLIKQQHSESVPPLSEAETTIVNEFNPYPDIQLAGGNTGDKGFANLQEYNTDTNIPTGETKPNIDSDPDYVAPGPDTTTCPPGPDVTSISYGYSLQISKVQLNYNGTSNLYADSVANTDAGGYSYIKPLPKNTPTTISVKAKTLDSGNTNGYVKARVNYYDSGGNSQTFEWNVPNDVETTLPGTFSNITNVNISNY